MSETEMVQGKLILQSPNDQLRVQLELTDDGDLKLRFFANEGGNWEESQGKSIARWLRSRETWICYR